MTIEDEFKITPDQISESGIKIRKSYPSYIWGDGELRNAIFESFVIQLGLPWNKMGFPEWSDPKVQDLHRQFSECLRDHEQHQVIDGIIARCTTENCRWRTIGQAKVDKVDRILKECGLTAKCRQHHLGSGEHTKHNRFQLYKDDRQIGIASVSSQVCTGYIEK